jgi:hypothetical protein
MKYIRSWERISETSLFALLDISLFWKEYSLCIKIEFIISILALMKNK